MKVVKIIAMVLLVVFVGMQFMPTQRNQSEIVPKSDFLLVNKAPKNMGSLLQTSCYDCHSNNTDYPWYNTVQPLAWFLEDHVKNGKSELNFSLWDALSDRRKSSKLRSIIKQIKSGKMPLDSYLWVHKDAKFSDEDKTTIIQWVTQLKNSL